MPGHHQLELERLEKALLYLIDQHGIARVLRALANVAADRAEHLARAGWAGAGKTWMQTSVEIERIRPPALG
jgi:hypothetical protein